MSILGIILLVIVIAVLWYVFAGRRRGRRNL